MGASAGREAEPALLLQAHTDMVTEKNEGTVHDFAKDPLHLVQEGNILRADGTTLGADDGYGVSMILAVLTECKDHPALECLFTASEETGMDGALAFDYSKLSARALLNLDGGEEDLLTCGCCGGLRSDLHLPVHVTEDTGMGLRIVLDGLCGGHSGEDIHRGRANALALMSEILHAVKALGEMRFSGLHGGDKSNAIPRDCVAVITTPDPASAIEVILAKQEQIRKRLVEEDASFRVTAEVVRTDALCSVADTERILCLLSTSGGVMEWHEEIKGLPYTSRNVASVRLGGEECLIVISHRSFDFGKVEASGKEIDARVASVGGCVHHHNAYPGWDSPVSSPLIEKWRRAYEGVTGTPLRVNAIHAGLECGLFAGNLPGLSAISLGCNIKDLHTPAERMELSSYERIYRTLLTFLKKD
jgi:dipeptidase D